MTRVERKLTVYKARFREHQRRRANGKSTMPQTHENRTAFRQQFGLVDPRAAYAVLILRLASAADFHGPTIAGVLGMTPQAVKRRLARPATVFLSPSRRCCSISAMLRGSHPARALGGSTFCDCKTIGVPSRALRFNFNAQFS